MIRRRIKIARVHLERFQNVLVDVDFVVVSTKLFNYPAKKNYCRVRVAELAAGLEQNFGERKHRDELGIFGWLERLPVLTLVPRPGWISETGRVRHQMTDRYVVHRPELVVNIAKLRQEFRNAIIQLQKSAIAKRHEPD